MGIAYTYVFGGVLCVGMIAAILYYYMPRRKGIVEKPKYEMLDDTIKSDETKDSANTSDKK